MPVDRLAAGDIPPEVMGFPGVDMEDAAAVADAPEAAADQQAVDILALQ